MKSTTKFALTSMTVLSGIIAGVIAARTHHVQAKIRADILKRAKTACTDPVVGSWLDERDGASDNGTIRGGIITIKNGQRQTRSFLADLATGQIYFTA